MNLSAVQGSIVGRIVEAIAATQRQQQGLHAELNEVVRLLLGTEYKPEARYQILPGENGWRIVEVIDGDPGHPRPAAD